MTIRRAAVVATVSVAALLVAFGLGRASKTCPAAITADIVAKQSAKQEDKAHEATAAASTATANVASARTERVVVRRFRSDGTLAMEKQSDIGAQSVAAATKVEKQIEYRDRWHTAEAQTQQTTHIQIAPATRFHLKLLAGATVLDWRKMYGGTFDVRIAGPFTLGLGAASIGGKPAVWLAGGFTW